MNDNDPIEIAKSIKPMKKGPSEKEGRLALDDPKRAENLAAWHEGSHPLTKNINGSPKVVYHGTADNIEAFKARHPHKKDNGWLGKGNYFTDTPRIANSYALMKAGDAPNVIPAYVSIKNPYMASAEDKKKLQEAQMQGDLDASELFSQHLQRQGHDGVILDHGNETSPKEYVTFHPTQIKSAVGNNGQFDPTKPNIHEAHGGAVDAPHPCLSIPGAHIRHEQFGEPTFTGSL